MVQLSHPYMTTGKTVALNIWTFVDKVMSLLFNTLSRFVITFLSTREATAMRRQHTREDPAQPIKKLFLKRVHQVLK